MLYALTVERPKALTKMVIERPHINVTDIMIPTKWIPDNKATHPINTKLNGLFHSHNHISQTYYCAHIQVT